MAIKQTFDIQYSTKTKEEIEILERDIFDANTTNKLLIDRLVQLDNENEKLKNELITEATKVRIPNKLNAYQYNELCAHLTKIRQQFVEALNTPSPALLDIYEPAKPADEQSASHVN